MPPSSQRAPRRAAARALPGRIDIVSPPVMPSVSRSPSAHPTPGVLAIVGGAALVIAAIGLRGDFPLSDDWSYAYSSRVLCTEGVLRFLPWTGATLVLQSWYGAALCRLF